MRQRKKLLLKDKKRAGGEISAVSYHLKSRCILLIQRMVKFKTSNNSSWTAVTEKIKPVILTCKDKI